MNFCAKHTTAVLVFALSSKEELRHKKIAKGGNLFDKLTEHAIKTVRKTGLPVFHITEDQQLGKSFGERFTNAIQFVFDQGYENVITVGNDSPHLNRGDIETALSNLEDKKSVIGPSADGGFYLMGLHRSDFKKVDFKDLSWQTASLRQEIMAVLSKNGKEIGLLSTLFDIDTIWDAQIVGKSTSALTRNVAEAIISLISSNEKIETPSFSFISGFYSSTPHNKGSPFLSIH